MTSPPRLTALLVVDATCALAVACVSACSRGPVGTPGIAPPTGIAPPPLTVLARRGAGDIFIAPAGDGYPAGPEIVTTTGKVVWFHRLPAGEFAADFRTQTYLGPPVLTWFQSQARPAQGGRTSGPGLTGPTGVDYIYNDQYQQIATVRAGNGAANTFHEFLITPWNTALIVADTTTTRT